VKRFLVLIIILFAGISLYSQNIFNYPIHANGGLRVGGNTKVKVDSLSSDGTDIKFYNTNDTLNPYIPYANRTSFGDALRQQTRVFNVLDYGADPTGVVAAQTYIQNAIDAAHAYSLVSGMGGTVIVPAGNYKISGKMTLRSYMTVNVANNAYFLKFGTSAPFFVFEPTLNDCTLEGGYYDCNGVGSFMADTITNGNYAQLNHFKDLYILSSEQTLSFRMEGDGWMNANTFSDIVVNQFTSFLDETIVTIATGAFDGNRFTNLTLQIVPSVTTSVIKKLDGDANTFDNIMVWDWDYVTTGSHFCINFTGDSHIIFLVQPFCVLRRGN